MTRMSLITILVEVATLIPNGPSFWLSIQYSTYVRLFSPAASVLEFSLGHAVRVLA